MNRARAMVLCVVVLAAVAACASILSHLPEPDPTPRTPMAAIEAWWGDQDVLAVCKGFRARPAEYSGKVAEDLGTAPKDVADYLSYNCIGL